MYLPALHWKPGKRAVYNGKTYEINQYVCDCVIFQEITPTGKGKAIVVEKPYFMRETG